MKPASKPPAIQTSNHSPEILVPMMAADALFMSIEDCKSAEVLDHDAGMFDDDEFP